jgi:periplasmic protein TonB
VRAFSEDRLSQPRPVTVPARPLAQRLRAAFGDRRTVGLGLALLVEALLLLALLSLSVGRQPAEENGSLTVVDLPVEAPSIETPEADAPAPETSPDQPQPPQPPTPPEPRPAEPSEQPPQPSPAPPQPSPPARIIIPSAPSAPAAAPPAARPPAPAPRAVYGPPNKGGGSIIRDTERVGTMPNGEPLYAAAWYREPSDKMLGDYLASARGPGWGLIACRTAPQYRVEDCVGLEEYPQGSQIMRSILAAAWEFKVRPPRVGGRELTGTWVRIRIDYSIGGR